ncbi:MAG: hypothetical protein KKH34_05795 [Candidatus Omnitrophica bacterium]|nr:hypothetical protein [Candidatus Omnitrophota bacterium]
MSWPESSAERADYPMNLMPNEGFRMRSSSASRREFFKKWLHSGPDNAGGGRISKF